MRQLLRSATTMMVAAMTCAVPAVASDLSLAPIYSDNMVLQHGRAVPVEGTASAGTVVSVWLDEEKPVAVQTDGGGHWRVELTPQRAGRVAKLNIKAGDETVSLANVAFGDVFLCSGQSNMEFTLRHATNADVYIAQSANPGLRLITVPRQSSTTPQSNFSTPASWAASTPASAIDFSAVCYFMGAELQAKRKIPIGLIAASWGGSVIQEWMTPETLRSVGGFEDSLTLLALRGKNPVEAATRWSEQLDSYFIRTGAKLAQVQPADISTFWEDWGDPDLATFDGTGVFTASINLTAEQARNATKIIIGRVDDAEQTLINGQVVGASMGWDTVRIYELPDGILHGGSNKIEVRALDTGGGGGMWGKETRGVMLKDGSLIPVTVSWQFRRGSDLSEGGTPPYVPWVGGSGLTTLYNGMIAPLGRIPLAGIAWYQGEANVANARQYSKLLPAMIAEWRSRFDTKPFVMAQLANFGPLKSVAAPSAWAELRESQRRVVASDKDAGMAVTIDIGDPYDIHPTNKRDVGRRLALALEGKQAAAIPVLVRRDNRTVLQYSHAVRAIGHHEPIGFEACDSRGQCRFIRSTIAGQSVIMLETAASDRKIRYLWADSPIANLFDEAGIALTPFEADLP